MGSTTIPQLPQVLGLDGSELMECVQGGVSRRLPTSMLISTIAPTITIGSTVINGGITGNILYDNGGIVGEKGITGTGNVVLDTMPVLVAPALGTPSSVTLTNAIGLPLATGVSGILPEVNGGTGIGTYTTGDILYASATNVLSKLSASTNGFVLTLAGGIPVWSAAATGVASFSAGATGLTPNTPTAGAIVLSGTLAVLHGGTGATTSTGSGSVVLATSPTLVTPIIGVATGTSLGLSGALTAASLALGGATLGANVFAATGTAAISGILSAGAVNATATTIPVNGTYLPSANTLGFSTNTILRASFDSSGNLTSATANSWSLRNTASSATVPTVVPDTIDITSGIGSSGSGKVNIITAGFSVVEWAVNLGTFLQNTILSWSGRSQISSPVNGNFLLTDSTATTFGLLQLGATSAAAPAIKRVSAALAVRAADDSGDADFTARAGTFSGQLQGLGTNTNNNASAGQIGEYIISTVVSSGAVAISSNTSTTITTIALTAGDWDIEGAAWYSVAAASMGTTFRAWASTTAGTVPLPPANGYNYNFQSVSGPNDVPIIVGPFRLSLAAPATLFLTGFVTINSGTITTYGFIAARRAR